ncbi:hypothetical protein niasHT_012491 [Heterodera trifolii]|uniref:Uncharacterized protein n=1 Tax=Heterodera trifolii TaxID=157864 RepID=A0ABD2KUV8_9BILA
MERMVTFPSSCVAAYRPEERPMLPFTFRDYANDTNCDAAAKLCAQHNGNGICFTCSVNLCNGIGNLLVAEWEEEGRKAIPFMQQYAFILGEGYNA